MLVESMSASGWVFAGIAALLIGLSKAGFGIGGGLVAVPMMALALPTDFVLGVMLPLLIAGDVFANWHHLGHQSWRHLRPLLIGALIGVVLGTLLLIALQLRDRATFDAALDLTVGGVCLAFVVIQVYRLLGGHVPHLPAHPLAGAAAGCLAATVSTLTHSAGMIVSLYLLERRLEKTALTATLVTYFLLINLAKLPTYLWRELITPQTLVVTGCVALLVPVGTLIGVWLHRRIAQKPFVATLYLLAALAAARMIYRSLG